MPQLVNQAYSKANAHSWSPAFGVSWSFGMKNAR